MSYVRTDEQMKKKIETFHHSAEFDTDAWYNNIWLPWDKFSGNLHPVVPAQFEFARLESAPESLRKLINWDS
jgi:hypothetical protein